MRLAIVAVVVAIACCGGCSNSPADRPQAEPAVQPSTGGPSTRAADEKKPDEATNELSVVDYDSKTHGAVQVKSVSEEPTDSFDVLRDGERAFDGNPKLLNGTLKLAPGAYVVVVNRTERKVNIEAGKKTILLTGDLIVESKREVNFWIPKQGKETKLTANPPLVNRSVALFPG